MTKKQSSFKADVRAYAQNPNVAELFLFGEIMQRDPDDEYWWLRDTFDAREIVSKIENITASKINVYIKSHGGSYFEAVAIRSALARKQAEITFYLESVVASAATIIPMIKGQTVVMASNALFMIHAPSWDVGGNAVEHREIADYLDKLAAGWTNVIVEKTGRTYEEIYALLTDGKDHDYSAEEALAFGFIDQIGNSVPITASALPKDLKLPTAWLKSNKITATYQPEKLIMPTPDKPTDSPEATNIIENINPVTALAALNAINTVEAAAVEAKRRADINDYFSLVSPERTAIHAMKELFILDPKMTLEKVQAKVLEEIGKGQDPVARHHHVQWGSDGNERFQADAVDALLMKGGIIKVNANNSMRGWRTERIAEECLIRAGLAVSGDKMSMVSAAFTQSTSDFPILLENAMHKTLLTAYQLQPDTWNRFCATGSVADFNEHNRYFTGSLGDLSDLNELGEFENGTIPDGKRAKVSIGTKGKIINISRKAIINDDLGAFLGLAQGLGRAAKRTIENTVYAYLASNPKTYDNKALFHADHKNIMTASIVTAAAFVEGSKLMSEQKDINGEDFLDLMTNVWVGGKAQSGNAKIVNNDTYDPDTTNALQRTNIAKGTVSDIIETPRISGNKWYMFADATIAPVLEVSFLDGNTEPYIEMQNGWNVDGSAWKVRHDFGVSVLDFRGAVYNAGA